MFIRMRKTGGPARYDGKDMTATHSAMNISNPEFDAALGDLKASLDKLRIPNKEQRNFSRSSKRPVPKSSPDDETTYPAPSLLGSIPAWFADAGS